MSKIPESKPGDLLFSRDEHILADSVALGDGVSATFVSQEAVTTTFISRLQIQEYTDMLDRCADLGIGTPGNQTPSFLPVDKKGEANE